MPHATIVAGVLAFCALVDAQVPLGAASAYGVFAATTITNTGLTTVGARIGLSPGSSITGFPPGLDDGQDIDNDAATAAAADIAATYASLVALPATDDLTGQDLGGQTLDAGVYSFSSSAQLTGILTLDAQGNPDATFVFQIGSTLTTATAASVVLVNGALPCNVYWQVGSSATLGTATIFAGNVLAEASITVTTGVSLVGGGFYAITAAVTLDDNIIDPSGACSGSSVPSTSSTSSATAMSTTSPGATITTTSTSTVTDPASTTTITVTISSTATVTDTVATTYTTCTSTTTSYSTKSTTKTASPTACPTSTKAAKAKRNVHTSTKTVKTTCAGHTSTHTSAPATHTLKTTCTSTSTHWKTAKGTITHTSTHTPACTSSSKAKRDYRRIFA